jgi:AraC family transcriptional regulator
MNKSELHQASPVVGKRQAKWAGIRLEHYHFRAGVLPEHQHQEHLVALSLTDLCRGEIRTASGFRARTYSGGSVCVIPAGQKMSARLESEAEHLALYLDPALVLRVAAESYQPGGIEVIEKCAPHDQLIRSVGLALLSELETEGLGGRLYAESLANVLAVHLLRHYTASGRTPRRFTGGLSGLRLQRVTDFINDHYESDVSLAELAQVAGMSTFHFAREFKRTTGTTPHQYLIQCRIERAKSLLAAGELPLVEVGARTGFSHQSHFTRLFRKLTGTTPQSYRLMLQP